MIQFVLLHPQLISLYIGLINLIAALVTISDKKRARQKVRRIPEKTLWTLAVLGGSPAMLVTMHLIRHKTQHKIFMLGMPVLILVQLVILYLLFRSF